MNAEFTIIYGTSKYVFIVDTGHTHTRSVTNDAENVIKTLYRDHGLGERRVFYVDSEGQIDEMLHKSGCFQGFVVHGTSIPNDFLR